MEQRQGTMLPDYDNSLPCLANSVLRHFGIDTKGRKTLAAADRFLDREYKNVVVILLDALGKNIIDGNLEEDGFFATHTETVISSVFPPTTVAATTSVQCGLEPVSHGWLGWDNYYPPIDKNVEVFTNKLTGTNISATDYYVAGHFCPYENVVESIRKTGFAAHLVTPFSELHPVSDKGVLRHTLRLCNEPGRKYIYSYWREPDGTIHRYGCFSKETAKVVRNLERRVQAFCEKTEDTLVFVTADHGHKDTKTLHLSDVPGLLDCLLRGPSIEPRAMNFFVKSGKAREFAERFQEAYGADFILLTKEEVIESGLFGSGPEHPLFRGMLGDFLAVATGDKALFAKPGEDPGFKAMHAGLTKEEMQIPLIVYNGK
ncbi:MAG: alkaline phosphatase family protein [Lachnospiraceae bacterium]|nr:alkaline phosphatase family protein [Lachnospiraceae bacterium]